MSEFRFSDEWAIDAVCNLFTPEVVSSRPKWSQEFLSQKIGFDAENIKGVSLNRHIELLDEAKISHAFLLAPKMGRVGLPESWSLDPKIVSAVVEKHPDRFSGIIGIDPYSGMKGVRELETYVKEYGFIGAHSYPHWFELPPDHARFYPFYAKCAELGVPIQMQVGHCLRYSDNHPLPSVGRPLTLDTIACHVPELKIIGIHIGWPWVEEMIAVAYKHPNVFIGSDAYAPKYWDDKFIHFINTFGQDKVIFGTDWPVIPHLRARNEIADLGIKQSSLVKFLSENTREIYSFDR
jgi:predicted TIM-barrel fold metal-dependent hydrolase